MAIHKNKRFQSILLIAFYLVLLDIAINIIFKFPEDPQKDAPSAMQEYFEYGRSIEGKYKKMAFVAKYQRDPTLGYGWLKRRANDLQPFTAGENKTLVAVYGMSHTKLLGDVMAKIDSKYVIRDITAPGAPVNWAYTAYCLDKEKHSAKIVILGIMTENTAFTGATLGAAIYFDLGHPYTFPKYFVENGILKTIYPPFISEGEFKKYRNDKAKWNDYIQWMKKNDKFYDAFLFKQSLADNSAFFRVMRRAYSHSVHERAINRVHTKDGFKTDSEEIITLRKIVEEFAESARRQKRLPVVYIVNNRGRGDHLYKALQPSLDEKKIPFLSTHIICPPDDPRAFLGTSSHFTPAKDIEIANEIINIIKKEQAKEIQSP